MLLQGLPCRSHLSAKWCQCPKPCSWLWMTPVFTRDNQHCKGIWSSERLLLSQWFYWLGVALNDRKYFSNSTMAYPVVQFCVLEETRLVFRVGHWRIQVLIRCCYDGVDAVLALSGDKNFSSSIFSLPTSSVTSSTGCSLSLSSGEAFSVS